MTQGSFTQRGTAITEVIVALLALAPFLIGIPLLGKQLDIKHKDIDAARYAVWERTVWRNSGSNRKEPNDIALEARDRILGDPRASVIAVDRLRGEGITENRLWRDFANRRLLDYDGNTQPVEVEQQAAREPVEVGYLFVPAFVYGGGMMSAAGAVMQVRELGMDPRSFATAEARVSLRPTLQARARTSISLRRELPRESDVDEPPLVQRASAAILSDSWSSRDESEFRRRVDDLTINEFVQSAELPSRVLALNALDKGEPLFGEGQFAWEADLRPSSTTLPAAYVERRR
jgi:hypothetical protein